MSMLYIQSNNEENIHHTQGNQVIKHKNKVRILHLLYEVLTKITLA